MPGEEKAEGTGDCEVMVKDRGNIKFIKVGGMKMSMAAASRKYGIPETTVGRRVLMYGRCLSVEQLTTPRCEQKKREYPAGPNTKEELEKLARIPGPTRWEYEARGLVPPAEVR